MAGAEAVGGSLFAYPGESAFSASASVSVGDAVVSSSLNSPHMALPVHGAED